MVDHKIVKEIGLFEKIKKCLGAFFASFIILSFLVGYLVNYFYEENTRLQNDKLKLIEEKSNEKVKKAHLENSQKLLDLKIKNFENLSKEYEDKIKKLVDDKKQMKKEILVLKSKNQQLESNVNRHNNIKEIEQSIKSYILKYDYSFLTKGYASKSSDFDKFENARSEYNLLNQYIIEKELEIYFKKFITKYHKYFYTSN